MQTFVSDTFVKNVSDIQRLERQGVNQLEFEAFSYSLLLTVEILFTNDFHCWNFKNLFTSKYFVRSDVTFGMFSHESSLLIYIYIYIYIF